MSSSPMCFLIANDDDQKTSQLIPRISIPTNFIDIGRSPITNIRDPCCSRNQISIKANFNEMCVHIKQTGTNSSTLNGFTLERGATVHKAFHGDIINLIPTKYSYRIEFDPEPMLSIIAIKPEPSNVPSKKRTASPSPSPPSTITNAPKKNCIEPTITPNNKPFPTNTWASVDDGKMLVFTAKGVCARKTVAAYDIDGTIIKTKSGNVFPKNQDDWCIAFDQVPGKLRKLHDEHKIVFFTNQAGIATGKTNATEWKRKLEFIVAKLAVPVQVFVSTSNGHYRKPRTGMWDMLCSNYNEGIVIDKKCSFYVGDAAGRPEKKVGGKKQRKDHSLADRLFATNVGISFHTPEEHFCNAKLEKWNQPEFDPTKTQSNNSMLLPTDCKIPLSSSKPEVIVMVGGPGSGKSHFARTQLEPKGYTIINRDTLGTWNKCVKLLSDTLTGKKSAVIDNTNPDKVSRSRYTEIAKKFDANCRCFVMATPWSQVKHNNVFRELTDSTHSKISDMVLNGYKKKYCEPNLNEGFTNIVRVNCVPQFKNEDHEKLYKTFLLDK